ncbi:hypothetical protein [Fretibacter rubidus]|uniref:hypothetical protein n=1 Tax=Fretibacter rubidus TaxID=570162 RepID=UPI003529DC4B
MSAWWNDFNWSWRGITVKETGANIRFNSNMARDVMRGLPVVIAEKLRGKSTPDFTIAALPHAPRPWYLLWAAIKAGGGRLTPDLDDADAVVYFDDSTYSDPPVLLDQTKPTLNFGCTDISKSHVATIFERIFGYALTVDPLTHKGPMVQKGEANGVHDGQIVRGPIETPLAGAVYQRVVDNSDGDDVADLRCPTVGGTIPLVYIKRRPYARRFDNMNATVTLSTPDAHFDADERLKISQFCAAMGLDWGGLDILRDNESGKIFIVDVNKTDMGPPLALPLAHKLRSTRLMGAALADFIKGKTHSAEMAAPIVKEQT